METIVSIDLFVDLMSKYVNGVDSTVYLYLNDKTVLTIIYYNSTSKLFSVKKNEEEKMHIPSHILQKMIEAGGGINDIAYSD